MVGIAVSKLEPMREPFTFGPKLFLSWSIAVETFLDGEIQVSAFCASGAC